MTKPVDITTDSENSTDKNLVTPHYLLLYSGYDISQYVVGHYINIVPAEAARDPAYQLYMLYEQKG
jgi:hypothetical protein